jgi:hypothetical protein
MKAVALYAKALIKKLLSKPSRYLYAVNINPLSIARSLIGIPRFLSDRRQFFRSVNEHEWPIRSYPILSEWNSESANLGEYFWQDLFVAKQIISENPARHVDVGSRVDGFIAHLACIRPVEVFDIRPLTARIDNVSFNQWDATNPDPKLTGVADCVSCLHTLEHIGLGRYGDPIDPDGWKKGLSSLARLVMPGGGLWLSVPIGIQHVEFNAHRVFAPKTINDEAKLHHLKLSEFHFLEGECLNQSLSIDNDFERLASVNYALGIFYFKKELE